MRRSGTPSPNLLESRIPVREASGDRKDAPTRSVAVENSESSVTLPVFRFKAIHKVVTLIFFLINKIIFYFFFICKC